MSANPANNEVLKVLVLGDPATGKTSFIKRSVHNFFSTHHRTTIGVDFALKQLQIGDASVRLQLWDIAGEDRFGAIARVYYKDALGAFLTFDVSRPSTFRSIAKLKRVIDQKVLLANKQPLPVVLLANKSDLAGSEGAFDIFNREMLDEFCAENGLAGWFDTSAKTAHNTENAVRFLVTRILEHTDVFEIKRATRERLIGTPRADDTAGGDGCACC